VRSRPILTESEARRAIYIDFEGNENRRPTLLGILWGDDGAAAASIEQVIVEELFWPCAGKRGARDSVRGELSEAVERVCKRAQDEDRRIVSWSEHDLTKVTDWVPASRTLECFSASHVNAIPTAQAWIGRKNRPPKGDNTLSFYLRQCRYRVPDRFGPGKVGRCLTEIRKQFEDGATAYGGLSLGARKHWRVIAGHNRHDCRGLRYLMVLATTSSR
jgi:hypothetical protein